MAPPLLGSLHPALKIHTTNAGRMAWWPWIDDSDLGTLLELPYSTNPSYK